mgnify:CR=1 FL=1
MQSSGRTRVLHEDVIGRRWQDINSGAVALIGASAPALTNVAGGLYLEAFSGTGPSEQVFGSFEVLHDYKEGTDLWPHIHWLPLDSTAGDVKWNLEYSIARMGQALTAPAFLSGTQAAGGSANVLRTIETSTPIPGTGMKIGDQVIWRLFRNSGDVADTYAGLAAIVSFGVHYEVDDIGSNNKTSN